MAAKPGKMTVTLLCGHTRGCLTRKEGDLYYCEPCGSRVQAKKFDPPLRKE